MINNMKDKNDIETVYVSDRCIILMWEESTNGLTDEDLIELKIKFQSMCSTLSVDNSNNEEKTL